MKKPKAVEGYEFTPNEILSEEGVDEVTFIEEQTFNDAFRKVTWYECEECKEFCSSASDECLCSYDEETK